MVHSKWFSLGHLFPEGQVAQLRMARYTLIFMGCYAVFLASPWCSAEKLEGLGAVTDLIFLSGAGIVGAYMGTTAWMSKK